MNNKEINDAKLITELGIFEINIASAINDTTNKNTITVTFKQSVRTKCTENEKATYFGQMHHTFNVFSVQDAWPEVVRRAQAYRDLEIQLEKGKSNE